MLRAKHQTSRALAEPGDPPAGKRYEKAKAVVEQYILANGLQPGDKLPTEEALRQRFGWSRVTIARALDALAWEGRLKRVQGSGTYVASKTPAGARNSRLLVSTWPYKSDDDYGSAVAAGVRDEAAQQGAQIVFHAQTAVPDPETVRRLEVDGVLSVCWQLDDLAPFLELRDAGIPVVGLAMRSRIGDLPVVCIDNYDGVRQALEFLVEAGHRKIAFGTLTIDDSDVMERLLSFHNTLAARGVAVNPDYMLLFRRQINANVVRRWWSSLEDKPTAMMLHGVAATSVLQGLAQLKVAIPGDLSVILVDDVRATRLFDPPLTVLRQPSYELGRRGLAKLIAAVEGTDDGRMEMLRPDLIHKDSVARRDPAQPLPGVCAP